MDIVAPDTDPRDPEALMRWVNETDIDPGAFLDELPPGPTDPPVNPASVDKMTDLVVALFAEAPIRGRETSEDDTGETES